MKTWNDLKIWGGLLLGVGLLFCQATSVLGALVTPFSVSLGFDFASGDYGTDQNTESTRIPLTIGYTPTDRLDFELVIPYLYQSNGSTINMGGMRFPRQGSGMGGSGGMGSGGPVDPDSAQSGIGDTTLITGYILYQETESTPMLRPLLYTKMPTGDADRGLGSGAYDFGAGLSLAKGFGDWFTYAETLYVAPGSSSTFNPDNYWTYLVAASYALTERLAYGIQLSGATAVFAGASDALDLEFNVNYRTSQWGSIGGYLSKGMSTGSADYAIGCSGTIYF